LKNKDLREIGQLVGLPITGKLNQDGDMSGLQTGDRMVFLEGLSRNICKDLRELWEDDDEGVQWSILDLFNKTLQKYKEDRGLYDFTDMLTRYLSDCGSVDVEVAIIDEAQDLTPLQWRVVEHAFRNVKRMYLAGDDDQAIYAWSGADIRHFLSIRHDQQTVLPVSYRLPQSIFKYASTLSGMISARYKKQWSPTKKAGTIEFHNSLDYIELDEKSWMLLARNIMFLKHFERVCMEQGFIYNFKGKPSVDKSDITAIEQYEALRNGKTFRGQEIPLVADRLMRRRPLLSDKVYGIKDLVENPRIWHDELVGIPLRRREYYLAVRRRGRKLLEAPKIHIDTIHGVKGGEADNVVVLSDVTSKVFRSMAQSIDNEARVFYVGVTRAKEKLHIVLPQTSLYFDLGRYQI